jgi:Cytochrome c oxidase subunit IV
MRVEVRVVVFGMVFVGILAAVYWFTSYEDAGAILLVVGAAMYATLSGYLYLQSRRLRNGPPRPADDEDPPEPTGDVPVGYFPVASVWPAALGVGAVSLALGLVFGIWFFVIAAILVVGAIIGYSVEAQARP